MVPREDASRSALQHLLRTFFGSSRTRLMAAPLDIPDTELSDERVEELARLAALARRQGS